MKNLTQHIQDLKIWRQRRISARLDVDDLDRAIRVAEAYQVLLMERRMHQQIKQKDMLLGGMTLVAVAAIAFALGRK